MTAYTLDVVTDESFKQVVLDYTGSTIVLCEAPWSGSSHIAALLTAGLREDLHASIRTCRIDTDQNPDTSARYGVDRVPTLLFFQGGKLVDHMVGTPSREQILCRAHRMSRSGT